MFRESSFKLAAFAFQRTWFVIRESRIPNLQLA